MLSPCSHLNAAPNLHVKIRLLLAHSEDVMAEYTERRRDERRRVLKICVCAYAVSMGTRPL